jgi:hypothetical protein
VGLDSESGLILGDFGYSLMDRSSLVADQLTMLGGGRGLSGWSWHAGRI